MGGARREGETPPARRVDPRTKYSHLKIKPKGSSSPGGSKRPNTDSSSASANPSFKIPKLLQDSSALDRPMDPRDLFKGVVEAAESDYSDVPAAPSLGIFKSNFFPRSQQPGKEGEGPAKQPFGEITLEGASGQDSKSSTRNEGEAKPPDSNDADSLVSKSPPQPSVPSYLAQLDVGRGTDNDLKIDSAFGSLATDKGEGGGASSDGKKEELQARKLPSMFGLGF